MRSSVTWLSPLRCGSGTSPRASACAPSSPRAKSTPSACSPTAAPSPTRPSRGSLGSSTWDRTRASVRARRPLKGPRCLLPSRARGASLTSASRRARSACATPSTCRSTTASPLATRGVPAVCMAAPERLLTYQRTPTLTSSFSLTLTQTLTPTPTRNVASMAVAPDGTAMATSGYDGLVKIWVGNA